ncbi:MAG: 3-hydroxybutyryl-CoA dehydrogenase [Arenicella sp.]|nr:3-hydroxybutyryl-CoA dehydrogenase [Arenicella sp.]
MDIAVLGGGHGCYAAAAELSENGHQVRFWRRDSGALEPVIKSGGIRVKDFKGERDISIAKPTDSLKDAIEGAQLIVIPLPALAHVSLAKQCAPLWRDGQVVFLPPGTLGSYLFLKEARAAGNQADVTFGETGTLPYLARKHGDNYVVISGYGKRLPTGFIPAKNDAHARSILSQAYPAIEDCEDALSGALMNAGPIIHPPLIMMNAGPLEHFDTWDIHNEGTQASIRKVTDALDGERIAIREKLGYTAPHYPLADHYSNEGDEWMYGRGAHDKLTDSGDWREDIDLQTHRYMFEDTRIGLSLFSSIGKLAGVETPLINAFLALGGAITGRDFYSEGRTLESIGLGSLSRSEVQEIMQNGIPADIPADIHVAAVGAGRMGRGIALSFALSGAQATLIDVKDRNAQDFDALKKTTYDEITRELGFLSSIGMFEQTAIKAIVGRIHVCRTADKNWQTCDFDVAFEGVPEHREAKLAAFNWMNDNFSDKQLIASTTSTFLVDDLASMINAPERYANAHWLNPAHLMPLVEISRGTVSSDDTINNLKAVLTAVGKTSIVCSASPGYIVPRIQALAMNEAARLAEENVASVEDIDTAIRVGFGVRYAILGMLEFIDFGGGDILYYASDYLSKNVDANRYAAPKIIHENMHNNRNGVSDGKGFYDYENIDVDAYRKQRMTEFVGLLGHLQLLPKVQNDKE